MLLSEQETCALCLDVLVSLIILCFFFLEQPVSLELGGKSPLIVFDDVDIDKGIRYLPLSSFPTSTMLLIQLCDVVKSLVFCLIHYLQFCSYSSKYCQLIVCVCAKFETAVEWAMFGCFANAGQVCSATSRLLLHVCMFFCLFYSLSHVLVHDMKICTGENCKAILGQVGCMGKEYQNLRSTRRRLQAGVSRQ